jgi:hypothetical protein
MTIYSSPISVVIPIIFTLVSSIKILCFYIGQTIKPNKYIGYKTDKSLSNIIYWKFLNGEMLKVTMFLEGINLCIQAIFMFLILEIGISKDFFNLIIVVSVMLAVFNSIISYLWVNNIEKRLP